MFFSILLLIFFFSFCYSSCVIDDLPSCVICETENVGNVCIHDIFKNGTMIPAKPEFVHLKGVHDPVSDVLDIIVAWKFPYYGSYKYTTHFDICLVPDHGSNNYMAYRMTINMSHCNFDHTKLTFEHTFLNVSWNTRYIVYITALPVSNNDQVPLAQINRTLKTRQREPSPSKWITSLEANPDISNNGEFFTFVVLFKKAPSDYEFSYYYVTLYNCTVGSPCTYLDNVDSLVASDTIMSDSKLKITFQGLLKANYLLLIRPYECHKNDYCICKHHSAATCGSTLCYCRAFIHRLDTSLFIISSPLMGIKYIIISVSLLFILLVVVLVVIVLKCSPIKPNILYRKTNHPVIVFHENSSQFINTVHLLCDFLGQYCTIVRSHESSCIEKKVIFIICSQQSRQFIELGCQDVISKDQVVNICSRVSIQSCCVLSFHPNYNQKENQFVLPYQLDTLLNFITDDDRLISSWDKSYRKFMDSYLQFMKTVRNEYKERFIENNLNSNKFVK